MQEISIEKFCKENNYKLGEFAEEINVSISLLSKIKNGQEIISYRTQELFQSKFPNYKLIGGKPNWKEKCIELRDKNKILEETLKQRDYALETANLIVVKNVALDIVLECDLKEYNFYARIRKIEPLKKEEFERIRKFLSECQQ